MLRLLFPLPRDIIVAVSGGSDSIAVLHFLNNGRHQVEAAYFNHATSHADVAESFVEDICQEWDIKLHTKEIKGTPKKGESYESFWSTERNAWFRQFDKPVITAHHLDDAVEWWIYSSLKGNPKLMGASNANIFRPFIITPKRELTSWAERKDLPFLHDQSNDDTSYMRNYIRHHMMEDVLHVNPGLPKTIKKKYLGIRD